MSRDIDRRSPLVSTMDASEEPHSHAVVVWTHRRHASSLHATLKHFGWLHALAASQKNNQDQIGFPCIQSSEWTVVELDRLTAAYSEPFSAHLSSIELTGPSVNPHDRLERCVLDWYAAQSSCEWDGVMGALPTKWEQLGDMIVLNEGAFNNEAWQEALSRATFEEQETLWKGVALALGGVRLARQSHIQDNVLRSPKLTMISGESAWVEFSDFGVQFGFDAQKVMFSSGNITERHRIGAIDMSGETVIDAYAGAGYYTLPMLVRSGAKHVHACELNPASIEGLRWGAEANGVEDRLTIHGGDNQASLPSLVGIADRCHLGLLPSSEAVWAHAVACLKPKGGWLHIHMNVDKQSIERWCLATLEQLSHITKGLGHAWTVEAEHLERVKSYSPGVLHIVLDVKFENASE
jgi:tRNA G37 N-methylase Trm5